MEVDLVGVDLKAPNQIEKGIMDAAKLEQFVSVTGASWEVARSLLEACGGNLDLAINMHLKGRGGAASGVPQAGLSSLGSAALAGSEAKSYEEM